MIGIVRRPRNRANIGTKITAGFAMRDQQRLLRDILGAKDGGALKIDAPFLTFAELLGCVREISKHLYGGSDEISPHTVQGWFKAGIVTEHNKNRTTRNRLYCGLDLIRVASVVYLTQTSHLSAKTAGVIADVAVTEVDTHFQRVALTEPNLEIVPADYIVAVTKDGGWKIFCTDDLKFFNAHLKISGLCILFNYNLLAAFSIPILNDKWIEKATWFEGLIEREIAKKAPKKGKI
jgi:hypothetical protein